MVISLLFGCKAMDFYQEGDNFVTIQYYNLKEQPINTVTYLAILHGLESQSYVVDNDTLILIFSVDRSKPYIITGGVDNVRCGKVVVDGVRVRNYKANYSTLVSPLSFYQVSFPLLNIEGVERKDMAKWYKSFYAIKAIIKSNNTEEVYYYYNPSFRFLGHSYERPNLN